MRKRQSAKRKRQRIQRRMSRSGGDRNVRDCPVRQKGKVKEKDGGRVVLERTTKILQILESSFHSQAVVGPAGGQGPGVWKMKGLSWTQSILDFSRLSFPPHSVL